MSITQYPTINRTFTKVPVTFSLEGTQAKEKGLSVLNKEAVDDITVEVEISGMNYEIGGYTASDLIASVDTSNVSKEGTYDLNIEVRSAHTTDKVSIISVTPDTVSVSFDKITTKKIPVVSEAPLVTAMDGYTLRDTKVSPDSVTIEGPQNDIDKIGRQPAEHGKASFHRPSQNREPARTAKKSGIPVGAAICRPCGAIFHIFESVGRFRTFPRTGG